MSTTPPVVPVAKVSWLKKLGLDILKVLSIGNSVEKLIEKPVELLLPASAIAFNLWDFAFGEITNVEAGYAAITTAPTGVAKFNAVLPVISQALDQWVVANLPGSAQILAADSYLQSKVQVATNLTNTVVQFLNSLPASPQTATTPAGIATASVIAQLVKANPGLAASVTTGKKG